MTNFIEGEDRFQATLFPDQLDDYISEDSLVRVIDVFVEQMELGDLGFKTVPETKGRPAYHPAVMLKIYIYGYLNRIQSSRRLEREAGRNVELMWLTCRLSPDFKTIADFRKDNGSAIARVCREFVLICRKLNLFTKALVAIDGSKFKAVNARDRNVTKGKITRRLEQIDQSIARYLGQIESNDRSSDDDVDYKTGQLENKISKLQQEVGRLNALQKELLKKDDQQISETDPDARSMATSGRGSGMVGYNVQSAVDTKHHLIVAHEVTNVGHDRSALHDMAKAAKEIIDSETLEVVADRGYYNGSEILKCEKSGIIPHVPKTQTSNSLSKGLFDKRDFKYIEKDDEYLCPAAERLIWRMRTVEKGKELNKYWSSNCQNCHLKPKCTTGKSRRVTRWQHEATLEAMEARLAQNPGMMKIRKSTVEHPFGTIKSWMGATHFQMRRLKNVSTEMSLHVLAYNLKRAMKIIGIIPLIEAMRT
ncbi:MAG: IS1182 family transposase [Emcibacteraceae bacterium]|nr:IS1182 family transposase [Emcibacteraceae bacterium]